MKKRKLLKLIQQLECRVDELTTVNAEAIGKHREKIFIDMGNYAARVPWNEPLESHVFDNEEDGVVT